MSDNKNKCESMPLRGALLAMSWLLLGGCASVVAPGIPITLTENQRAELRAFPDQPYEMWQSVVFTLRGRNFPGFGVTRITPFEERFTSSCLTAQGMTLFDLAGQGDQLEICNTLPGAGDPQVIGQAFAHNIRSVYFENLPSPYALWRRDGDVWIAVSTLPDGGTVHHRFVSADGHLVEKRQFTQRGKLARSVVFKDYDETGPRLIELSDSTLRWRYTLTIRIKEWRIKGEPW